MNLQEIMVALAAGKTLITNNTYLYKIEQNTLVMRAIEGNQWVASKLGFNHTNSAWAIYTPPMDWMDAVDALKRGYRVRRRSWSQGSCIWADSNNMLVCGEMEHRRDWRCSLDSMEGTDWETVE